MSVKLVSHSGAAAGGAAAGGAAAGGAAAGSAAAGGAAAGSAAAGSTAAGDAAAGAGGAAAGGADGAEADGAAAGGTKGVDSVAAGTSDGRRALGGPLAKRLLSSASSVATVRDGCAAAGPAADLLAFFCGPFDTRFCPPWLLRCDWRRDDDGAFKGGMRLRTGRRCPQQAVTSDSIFLKERLGGQARSLFGRRRAARPQKKVCSVS